MHTWVHTADTCICHHTYVDTHTCHHMCVHILPDPQKTPPATHTSSHNHTSKHIRGVLCRARTLPQARARHCTRVYHMHMTLGTHTGRVGHTCTIRHTFTCTLTCSDTYIQTHTPRSGPGCHTSDQHHMASKVSVVGQAQTHPGHREPWADPRRMLPHTCSLPGRAQPQGAGVRRAQGTGSRPVLFQVPRQAQASSSSCGSQPTALVPRLRASPKEDWMPTGPTHGPGECKPLWQALRPQTIFPAADSLTGLGDGYG